MDKDRRQKKEEIIELVLPATVLVIIAYSLKLIADSGGALFSESLFFDSDVYSWLVRVEDLHQGQGWFDHGLHRVNPPEGHVQHWTRPLDAMIWAGGVLLAPLFGFREGLALWANIISPLLHLLVLWPMWRVARLLLNREEAAWALGAFALHWGTLVSFQWGRADHHSLLVGGQVVFFLAFMTFFLKEEGRLKNAFLCGLFGAFAVWVNLEALFYVLVGLAALGLYWLWGHRDLLQAAIFFSLGLMLGTAVGTVIEWGPFMLERHPVDTISVTYVVVFGLTTGFWAALWAVDGRRQEPLKFVPRAGLAGLCALVVLGGIYLISPELFRGPFHMVEELYKETRLANIGEQGPLLAFGKSSPKELLGLAVVFLYLLPPALWVSWQKVHSQIAEKEKWLWATMGVMALVCAVLAQAHAMRWLVYMPLGAAFGYGVFCEQLYPALRARAPRAMGAFFRPAVLFLFLFSPLVIGVALTGSSVAAEVEFLMEDEQGEAVEALGHIDLCDGRVPAAYLNDRELFPEPALVFIDPTYAPELLYRTDHHVLAVANHRPQPGYRFFVEVMTDRDFSRAHRRLRERQIPVMLLCVLDATQTEIWGARSKSGESPTLMEALMAGEAVEGFEVSADPIEGGGWWIYEVRDLSP